MEKIHFNLTIWLSMKDFNALGSIMAASTQKHVPTPKHPVLRKTSSGALDHLALSESLGYHIFRKKKRRSWSASEDRQLKRFVIESFVAQHGLEHYERQPIDVGDIDWAEISGRLSGRKPKECRKRWCSSLNPLLRKGKWTHSEDTQLIQAHKMYGSSWQKVASMIEGRNEDQCSKRYTEVLNTSTKDRLKPWNLEEDLKLIHGVRKFGTKWRRISRTIAGRPSLTCRNRWRRIMTDVAHNNASDRIMKAVGVLDKDGNPLYTFVQGAGETHATSTGDGKMGQGNVSSSPGASPEEDGKTAHGIKKSGQQRNSPNVITAGTSSASANGVNNDRPQLSPASSYSSASSTATATSLLGHRPGPPTSSYTEWRFALLDPRTNREIPRFSGPIAGGELAHQLVELARYNGVTLTIHQHIHNHYAASTPVLDPQASVSRFSHFNYLPPLTEVPKLGSSAAGSPTSTSERTDVALPKSSPENNGGNDGSGNRNGDDSGNLGRNFVSQRQQLAPTHERREMSREGSSNEKSTESQLNAPTQSADELDEEGMDFWETLRSITQPKPQSGSPVSQHHPLHYLQAGSNAHNRNEHREKRNGQEDEEGYGKKYGMYYNVFTGAIGRNGSNGGSGGNGNGSGSSAGFGYIMPFNPS